MSVQFIEKLDTNIIVSNEKETKKSLFQEYERVILDSLLQTFGLDFIIQDQYGGDVDTIHNLEQVGKNPEMSIKNADTRAKYENRGDYDSHKYHSDKNYIETNRTYSKERKESGIKDAYTGETLHESHDLDHIIAAKEIHDNAAVYATSLDPVSLVNSEDNLVPTIASINRSKGAKNVGEFLSDWEKGRPLRQEKIKELRSKTNLTDKERKQLKKYEELEKLKPEEVKRLYNKSKKSMINKLNKDYYTSSKFIGDTAKAAVSLGGKTALKQAIGFVLLEVWYAVKHRISKCNTDSIKDFFKEIIGGIKTGFSNAKSKFKDMIARIKEGFLSGVISSLMTTLTNMFTTMLKESVKILRYAGSALVQAFKVLFFDKHSTWQEKIYGVLVILATSASTIVGTMVGNYLSTNIGQIPVVGELLVTFIQVFLSGTLSCTLIYFIDKWEIAQKIYNFIEGLDVNLFAESVEYMKQQVAMYEAYVSKLLEIDIETVVKETAKYGRVLTILRESDEIEINENLKALLAEFNIELPWTGNFSSFIRDKSKKLVFQ